MKLLKIIEWKFILFLRKKAMRKYEKKFNIKLDKGLLYVDTENKYDEEG